MDESSYHPPNDRDDLYARIDPVDSGFIRFVFAPLALALVFVVVVPIVIVIGFGTTVVGSDLAKDPNSAWIPGVTFIVGALAFLGGAIWSLAAVARLKSRWLRRHHGIVGPVCFVNLTTAVTTKSTSKATADECLLQIHDGGLELNGFRHHMQFPLQAISFMHTTTYGINRATKITLVTTTADDEHLLINLTLNHVHAPDSTLRRRDVIAQLQTLEKEYAGSADT